MMKSDAKSSTTPVERRVATNGKKYRVEFKGINSAAGWQHYGILYDTEKEAIDSMERMNKTDAELNGEWSVI